VTKETGSIAEKLKRIEDLWLELERTKPDTPVYRALIERIFALSLEYQALVDASKKPDSK
jgi:chaperonin cofactor prefoldin